MKFILQVLTFLFLFITVSNASEFTQVKEIILKKDIEKKILVKYDDREKVLTFRWTLFKNGGLVIFRSYDTIVAQNILYLKHSNQSFRVILKPSGVNFYDKPFALISFKEFNYETREAKFELSLSDDSKNISLQYEKND